MSQARSKVAARYTDWYRIIGKVHVPLRGLTGAASPTSSTRMIFSGRGDFLALNKAEIVLVKALRE